MYSYIPVFVALILMFLGVPVVFAMFASSIVYFGFMADGYAMTNMIQTLTAKTMSINMTAGAFFMIAGCLMNKAQITRKLLDFCDMIVGHREGGLAHVNVLLSTLNGGVCSSAAADASLQCKILVPEMEKHGYPLAFSTCVTAATSLITPIIPPGNGLINYAILANVSMGQMFFAGYIPGILLCVAMMTVVSIYSHKNHWKSTRDKRASLKEIAIAAKDALWSFILPLVMIIGVRTGKFTATEGGIVLILLTIVIGVFVYKTLRFRDIPDLIKDAARSIGGVIALVIASLLFGTYLNWERIPQNLASVLMSVSDSKWFFMLVTNLILLFLGMFVEGTPLLLIMTPLLAPMAQIYGFNLVSFGIIIIINIAIGSLTPPFGGLMYITCGITKCSLIEFNKYGWAFILCMLVVLIILIVFPPLTTFLPNLVYGLN